EIAMSDADRFACRARCRCRPGWPVFRRHPSRAQRVTGSLNILARQDGNILPSIPINLASGSKQTVQLFPVAIERYMDARVSDESLKQCALMHQHLLLR